MNLAVLKDTEVHRLHAASIEILETIGVEIPHAHALTLFQESGASVDKETHRVKIPEPLIASAIEVCGKEFTLYGRDRSRKAPFGAGARNYNSSAGQALWVEDDASRRRYPRLEDVATATSLGDALPLITIPGAMADPYDLPPAYRCVCVAAEMLKNTTKPITFWFHDRASAQFLVELFAIVAGSESGARDHPLAFPLFEPISPLRFPHDGVDLLFETCRLPLPVVIGPMAQIGCTAPGTLAGTLAQENAEILAGLCLVQLIRPGTPVCFGGIPHAFNMRASQIVFGGPEQLLMAVAMTQLGRYYKLPVYVNAGLTDSKIADAQAGLEAGMTLLAAALAGADIFGHLGTCGIDQGASLIMLVMQHEAIAYIERVMEGISVDDTRLAIDVIRSVGPGGNFLAEEHTAEHFRSELWFPELLDRNVFSIWAGGGASNMATRCREMKDSLLRDHEPSPLPDDTRRAVEQLVDDARRHLT